MSINLSIINRFNIFAKLDQQLASNMKLFHLTKHNLLFVSSTDNSVFHYKIRDNQLKKLDSFCNDKQAIIKFDCSDEEFAPHFMALTDNGCLYSWGNNSSGQLGNDMRMYRNEPKLVISVSEYTIIDVCCGRQHSLVLTQTGYVFAFGGYISEDECDNCSTGSQLIPIGINISKVIAISCGVWRSIALTEKGELFSWGNIQFGNVTAKQLSVTKLKQIMCGPSYTLMLSIDGDIYFYGEIGGCLAHSIPTKLKSTTKFVKISATMHCDLCVALSWDNKCYILGKYGDETNKIIVKDIQQIEFSNIEGTFAFYEQITYKTFDKCFNNYNTDFIEICSLGFGGFSTVFKCKQNFDNKLYAMKKISFEPENSDYVCNELNILSQIRCDFVVSYFDSWIEHNYYLDSNHSSGDPHNRALNNLLYSANKTQLLHIQMELCSFTLKEAINFIANDSITTNDNQLSLIGYYIASELLYEILECVQYLHSQNPAIIHRDLKPENILITNFSNNRFVKLSDFGLSTQHESSDQSHTKYKGTVGYKAPELSYTKNYSTKVDNYSLGIIGQELFNFNISDAHKIHSPVLKPKMVYLVRLVEKLLSPVPNKRPNCDHILFDKFLWRLSKKQILSDKQFKRLLSNPKTVESIDENFIEFFVQKKCNKIRGKLVDHKNFKLFSKLSKLFQ